MAGHGHELVVRDPAALDGALGRPEHILAYDPDADAITVAVALAVSLARHRHPLADGNKRLGFIALGMTLGMNGHYLDATESDAFDQFSALASGDLDEAAFEAWVRARCSAVV